MRGLQWTYEDFRAYLLVYCSFADHIQVNIEREEIRKRIGSTMFHTYQKMIENDDDDTSNYKLKNYVRNNAFSQEQVDVLLSEIQAIFLCDGEFHKLEKRQFVSLSKLLQKLVKEEPSQFRKGVS